MSKTLKTILATIVFILGIYATYRLSQYMIIHHWKFLPMIIIIYLTAYINSRLYSRYLKSLN